MLTFIIILNDDYSRIINSKNECVSLYGISEFCTLISCFACKDNTLNQRVGIAAITLNKLEAEEDRIDRMEFVSTLVYERIRISE